VLTGYVLIKRWIGQGRIGIHLGIIQTDGNRNDVGETTLDGRIIRHEEVDRKIAQFVGEHDRPDGRRLYSIIIGLNCLLSDWWYRRQFPIARVEVPTDVPQA